MKTNINICRLVFAVSAFSALITSAFAASLSGKISDEQNQPLVGAAISIPALRVGVVSLENGQYHIDNLKSGIYVVEYKLQSFKTETREVEIKFEDITLNIALIESPLQFSPVTITASPQPTDVLTTPQSVSIIEGRQLDQKRGQTVINTLKNSPGLSVYSTGAGISKPVIRGLTSQRVLVVSDGVRQEGQQWGDEHAPEIDALDVDRVEVLRGPSSVIYGSDALGGVVNVIKTELPSVEQGDPMVGGKLLLNGFSNNSQTAGALSLFGASNSVGYRVNISGRRAGNINTPAGQLANSGEKELNFNSMIGLKRDWGSLTTDFSHFGTDLQIHENPIEEPNFTGFQKIEHNKIHMRLIAPANTLRIEVESGYQVNNRREYEGKNASESTVHLNLQTATLDIKAYHHPVAGMHGTVGASLFSQKNQSLAEEKLIPDFTSNNFAGFVYEQLPLDKWNFSAGLRVDGKNLKVRKSESPSVKEQTLNFSAVSATLGAVWHFSTPFALALNLGRGWRAPTAFELFIDGIHEGTNRYEIGDNHLNPEQSLNTDFSIRYVNANLRGEATIFQNKIDQYIFSLPTGEMDRESGLQKFQNTQADATLTGGEFALELQAADWLVLNTGIDLVQGTNDKTSDPLPLIPANRAKIGTRFIQSSMSGILNPYFYAETEIVSDQNRTEKYESKTGGYALMGIGFGGEFSAGKNKITADFSVENLFDKSYVDHLSRYKLYALNPGRNFIGRLSVPFTLKSN